MRTITYDTYFDKVYGCMIGKCVAGTAGAPYEGMKQKLNLSFSAAEADTTLPNDDLDLQILWLEALERKGIYINSDDLAELFLEKCPYSPGEYAIFKKNYRRYIHPPFSGSYNNPYYLEGMGCPIRSEIWACISPGDMSAASSFAQMDGMLDHGENSTWAERFLAALEAEAFFDDNLKRLIQKSLNIVPQNTRIFQLIADVLNWCSQYEHWAEIREQIIRRYGHPDCTNVFQNMGFLLTALLKGETELIKTMEIAINCGYDTDCTGATAGAVIGLILGAKKMHALYGFSDQTYTLGVITERRSNKISDLAEDICRVGVHFSSKGKTDIQIEKSPLLPMSPTREMSPTLSIKADYIGGPFISPENPGKALLIITNHTEKCIEGDLKIQSDTLIPSLSFMHVSVEAGEALKLPVHFRVNRYTGKLYSGNRIDVLFSGDIKMNYTFGFAGSIPWILYGPYWKNNQTVHDFSSEKSYMNAFTAPTPERRLDLIRDYHLNAFIDDSRASQYLKELSSGKKTDRGQLVYTAEDLIRISDLITYQGPCVIYMAHSFISSNERNCRLHIGCSDGFSLWMNGESIAEREDAGWWTAENIHIQNVHIKQGINTVAVCLKRHSSDSCFNFTFLDDEPGALGSLSYPEHIIDFEYVLP